MSRKRARSADARLFRQHAPVFAALSDETRLSLLATLSAGVPLSISQLTADSKMTRQAVTKHLRVLESAGLVRGETAGRERRFELEPKPLGEARAYLDLVSNQWDEALTQLKKLVETKV
jgi:DNA-binding transcriptional ArsR family regulator